MCLRVPTQGEPALLVRHSPDAGGEVPQESRGASKDVSTTRDPRAKVGGPAGPGDVLSSRYCGGGQREAVCDGACGEEHAGRPPSLSGPTLLQCPVGQVRTVSPPDLCPSGRHQKDAHVFRPVQPEARLHHHAHGWVTPRTQEGEKGHPLWGVRSVQLPTRDFVPDR